VILGLKQKFAKQVHEKGHFSIVLFVKPKKKRYLCTMKKGRQQAARRRNLNEKEIKRVGQRKHFKSFWNGIFGKYRT